MTAAPKYDPAIHHRRSIRLHHYDYSSAGAYFLTICAQNRKCLFGNIINGAMELNEAGKMVQAVWEQIPIHYRGTKTDAFVVMPNHVHGIIVIATPLPIGSVGADPRVRPYAGISTYPGFIGAGGGAAVQDNDHQTLCGWRQKCTMATISRQTVAT